LVAVGASRCRRTADSQRRIRNSTASGRPTTCRKEERRRRVSSEVARILVRERRADLTRCTEQEERGKRKEEEKKREKDCIGGERERERESETEGGCGGIVYEVS